MIFLQMSLALATSLVMMYCAKTASGGRMSSERDAKHKSVLGERANLVESVKPAITDQNTGSSLVDDEFSHNGAPKTLYVTLLEWSHRAMNNSNSPALPITGSHYRITRRFTLSGT